MLKAKGAIIYGKIFFMFSLNKPIYTYKTYDPPGGAFICPMALIWTILEKYH